MPAEPRLMLVAGDGCDVVDVGGRRFLDARGGLFNATVGYGRSEVVKAIREQTAALMTYGLGAASTPPVVRLAAQLAELFGRPLTRTLFVNSGSEATEAAVKIARWYHALRGEPSRQVILSLADGYHGTTASAVAMTRLEATRSGVAPLPEGFVTVPTPRCVDCGRGSLHGDCVVPGPQTVEETIVRLGPGAVAAFMVEPVLGVGGIVPLPAGYLMAVRRICDEHGVLLIVDEVLTGFGRTGAWFAHQAAGVLPDLVTTAKGLAAGYVPLAAVTARQGVFDVFAADPVVGGLRHGHTTSGHAVAAAAALAVLQVIADNDLVAHAAEVGATLLGRLRADLGRVPGVREVRGHGLLIGVQLDSVVRAAAVTAACQRAGVLVRQQKEVVAVAPPLIVTSAQAARIADTLTQATTDTAETMS
ncbi:aminotransferase family protein [Micromonospora endophytica]|uniref:aminotransferase family protein n=1 Tax=Micromonospora endophytica TaxID=515350 RepID=UPI001C33DD53|nr:aminotransferase class III-fold pyridoxal phosphate-dependent enzyme [Micromonospora endophytica]BCJ61580.1 aspartate aminotransferase family protein [Micromonospora endophytica]